MSTRNDIAACLDPFPVISLEEVSKASLMRRKDHKFIFSFVHLPDILAELKAHYRILEIDGIRSHDYQTFYYDTSNMDMYHMHHRGMANRHKIRFRRYGTSDIMFLEVKKKDAKGITSKRRMKIANGEVSIQSEEETFLHTNTPYQSGQIRPILENRFNRITLVSQAQTERITLDYQLGFSSLTGDTIVEIPGVSIAEIKFEKLLSGSPFFTALRKSHIRPKRFSKYCIGAALLDPGLKQNRFKERVRKVDQLNTEYIHHHKN